MQQPPHGRPLPGQQPPRPPAYVPPQQQQPPPQYQPQQQYQPPFQQQPAAPLQPPARPRKSRGALKFLAGTCVFSAWITLALSLLGAAFSFMGAAAASASLGAASRSQQYFPTQPPGGLLPGMGGLDGGGGASLPMPGGPFSGGADLLQKALPALGIAGGVFTLVTGIVTFLLFLGLGQAFYVLIDLEEQQTRMENMLQVLTLRPGGR